MSDARTACFDESYCIPLTASLIDSNITTAKSNCDEYSLETPKTATFEACTKMSIFLATFCEGINCMSLRHEVTNNIYSMCIDLIKNMTTFNKAVVMDTENGLEPTQAIDTCADFVFGKFNDYRTRYKRDKACEKMSTFVPPEGMMLGARWSMVRLKEAHAAVTRLVPCTFQYVSIIQTIKSLFNREDFRREFYRPKHQCKEGVYEDFCCGSTYQRNTLLMSTENYVQIQIATDDFEVANPLGSKATLHKICAVYFSIRNIPLKFRSRVDNIYLVMLCNTDDTKTKYTDFNDLWRVLHEISQLENGIQINGLKINGTVANLTFDNLGANTCLGFVENFSTSSHVCRFCMCDQVQRKTLCVEVPELMRTMENYKNHLKIVDDSTKVDYKQTKGVKRYCILNDLKYFNIFDNPSVDIMHDLNEGVFLFLMKHLFKHLIASKVATEQKLVKTIQYYDYGYLRRSNVPSALNLEKGNLNQTASQSKCLLLNLPFIFMAEKNNKKLENAWICVTSLLKISQIVYSSLIDEADIVCLEDFIKIHLSSMQEVFGLELTSKHHFLTHYPNVIRKMGPLKQMSSMRFESKHQVCKGFANDGNNFININKTVALRHQQYMAGVQNSYVDQISYGKSKLIDSNTAENLSNYLPTEFQSLTKMFELDYIKLNSFEYRKGLLVLKNSSLYKIEQILRVEDKYFFLTKKFDSLGIDIFTNSIKIRITESSALISIDFEELESRTVFEILHRDNGCYIIADTLELKCLF